MPDPTRPPNLRPGDVVRVVAPAGPFDRARFDAGLAWLRQRYAVRHGPEVYDRHRYFAGAVDVRQRGLLDALEDGDARAIFCARGGYGAMDLLPQLGLERHPPQLLVGFSDITALHLAWQAANRTSIHGPVVTQLAEIAPAEQERLIKLLEEPEPAAPVSGTTTLVGGTVRGRLVGGNLAVLSALIGTPYLPSMQGGILLLEDVGERPYRVDRMWTQLRLAGVFHAIAGIVLGAFTSCVEPAADHTVDEVLADLAAVEGVPCAAGFRIGHGPVNEPVPLGVEVELDADASALTFLSGVVGGEPTPPARAG